MPKRPTRLLLAALLLAALPVISQAFVTVGVSISVAPPPLPVYDQPPIPEPGYMWAPGYWAWDGNDYYWVPGTWVLAPQPQLLWTPGYWGWTDGTYLWHEGYWGPQVGFYGGVNYGYGYTGAGFVGGEWRGGTYFYNTAVVNVGSVHITNVYQRTVVNNITVNRVSFNGGSGGIQARATPAELAAESGRHVAATPLQRQQEQMARQNPQLKASANGGHPAIAATARPAEFSGHAVVAARDAGAGPALRTDRPPQAAQHTGAAPHNGAPGNDHPVPFSRPAREGSGIPQPPERAESRPPEHGAPHPQAPPHEEKREARPQKEEPHEH
jgi:hypothetical protein